MKNLAKVINGIVCPTMTTIKKASEVTGVSYNYIRQLCLTNKIIFVKTGAKYLINLEKFVEFLNCGTNEGEMNE